MREYEMIYVLRPDCSEEIVDRVTSKIDKILEDFGGALIERETWGKKKLAYEIQKHAKGQFFQIRYAGEGGMNAEILRVFRLDDAVLRYMPIRVADEVDVEARIAALRERRPAPVVDDSDDDQD